MMELELLSEFHPFLEKNEREKPAIRFEANGILKIHKSIETSFFSIFLGDILHRFNTLTAMRPPGATRIFIIDIRRDRDYKN